MMDKNEFLSFFGELETPKILVELLDFQNEFGAEEYAGCFYLNIEKDMPMFKTYSEDENFLNSLIEFAAADGTGSSYAFWLRDGNKNLETAPIVVFGSEGGYHIIAENLNELLQILTFDCDPMIDWDEIIFYKDDEFYEPRTYSDDYKKWLQENFQIESIDNPDEIIEKAQEKYQDEFYSWVGKYYSE